MEDFSILETNPTQRMDYESHLAGNGLRIANSIIDSVAFYTIIVIIFAIIGLTDPDSLQNIDTDSFMINVYAILGFVFYYFIQELIFKKTFGKMITGTKVISIKGEPLTVGQILGRTFARLIPFEAFSFLGGSPGWHDTMSKTRVVKKSFLPEFAEDNMFGS
ncbi:MAG: RDD family protein [Bacteroidetes bacterium]|nr:RDD family protein [Bacteroidota bacterium]